MDLAAITNPQHPLGSAITFSFPKDGAGYTAIGNSLLEQAIPTFGAFSAEWRAVARSELALIQAVTPLRFFETVRGEIRFASGSFDLGVAGFAFQPETGQDNASDVWLNRPILNSRDGGYLEFALAHELMHTLGFRHPDASVDDGSSVLGAKAVQSGGKLLQTDVAALQAVFGTPADAALVHQIERAYEVRGRLPDSGGAAFWRESINAGTHTIRDLVSCLMFDIAANDQFVQSLYRNVLGRDGADFEIQAHANDLSFGKSRIDKVLEFTDSLENSLQQLVVVGVPVSE